MSDQRGFTLIELIMVIVILGAGMAFVSSGFMGAADMARTQAGVSQASSDARRAMGTISREVRMVAGPTSWTRFTSTDLRFATVRSDSVRFQWAGTAGDPLLATYNTTVDTLVRNVDSLAFTYFLRPGTTTGVRDSIHDIQVYLRVNQGGIKFAERTYLHERQ